MSCPVTPPTQAVGAMKGFQTGKAPSNLTSTCSQKDGEPQLTHWRVWGSPRCCHAHGWASALTLSCHALRKPRQHYFPHG